MAVEEEGFVAKVTADIRDATKGFNDLLALVESTASSAGAALGRFDAIVNASGESILQMIAGMHPAGRTVMALVSTLEVAGDIGRKLIQTFATPGAFDAAEAALGDFRTAVQSTFDAVDGNLGRTLSSHLLGDADAIGNAMARIEQLGAAAIRTLQATFEAALPEQDRSTAVVRKQIEDLEVLLRQRLIEASRSPQISEAMNKEIDGIEAQLDRLRGILTVREFGATRAGSDEAADALVAGLRRTTEALAAASRDVRHVGRRCGALPRRDGAAGSHVARGRATRALRHAGVRPRAGAAGRDRARHPGHRRPPGGGARDRA